MWRSNARLVFGAVLLIVGGYCFFSFTVKGKKTIQRELAATPQTSTDTKSRPKEDDQILEAARLRAYGPLASVVTEEPTPEAPAQPHNTAPTAMDRTFFISPGAPGRLIHRRIPVKYAQSISFVIPAQAPNSRLQGSFAASGGAGAIDVMLMNPQEFDQFMHHQEISVGFSQNGSSRGQISWLINATYRDPQKYYLVFHSEEETAKPTWVDADFTLSFE